jgi:hypothetical protein
MQDRSGELKPPFPKSSAEPRPLDTLRRLLHAWVDRSRRTRFAHTCRLLSIGYGLLGVALMILFGVTHSAGLDLVTGFSWMWGGALALCLLVVLAFDLWLTWRATLWGAELAGYQDDHPDVLATGVAQLPRPLAHRIDQAIRRGMERSLRLAVAGPQQDSAWIAHRGRSREARQGSTRHQGSRRSTSPARGGDSGDPDEPPPALAGRTYATNPHSQGGC